MLVENRVGAGLIKHHLVVSRHHKLSEVLPDPGDRREQDSHERDTPGCEDGASQREPPEAGFGLFGFHAITSDSLRLECSTGLSLAGGEGGGNERHEPD